jgi:hypothetical protein
MESHSEFLPKDCSSNVDLQIYGIRVLCLNASELGLCLNGIVLSLFPQGQHSYMY